jgi:hypothetical protein
MSIAPVNSFPPERSESTANRSSAPVRSSASPASGAAARVTPPVLEPQPKPTNSVAKSVPVSYALPDDVVEVHQDPAIKDQLIIQYLDKAKDVVLQVPSAQELAVERGIAQDIQQAAKQRASDSAAATASQGAKTHGD